jgi:hypothetical protein
MPSYRGIDAKDLLKSITDAFELLETQGIGPECQKSIDQARAVDPATGISPLGQIAAATDDAGLAQAVQASGVRSLFIFTQEVLRFHALEDTGGKGLDVYTRLNDWGAMQGARFMAYYPIDGETQSYLAAAYAKKAASTGQGSLHRAFTCTLGLGREGWEGSRLFTQLVRLAKSGAQDSELKDSLLQLDISDRHKLVDAAAVSLGMYHGQKNNLPKAECLVRHGLVLDTMSYDWEAPEIKPIGEKVSKILEPFYKTDEVGMMGLGPITNNLRNGPQGIIFQSTRRAAQAVADAFPDYHVIDCENLPVEPSFRPPQQQSKSSPSGPSSPGQ